MKLRRWSARARAPFLVLALAAALGGCKGKTTRSDDLPVDTGPFAEAVGPSTYVPKVKNLLTGNAATAAEIAAVEANPEALRGLIDQWMTTDAFRLRMLDFFRNAFQQNNVSFAEITSSLRIPDAYVGQANQLALDIQDTFPRTAWQLAFVEGRPFTETVTTRRYMLSTAMMMALSYSEMFDVADGGRTTDRLDEVSAMQLVFDPYATHTDGTPITHAESIARFHPGRSGEWIWRIDVTDMTEACTSLIRAQRGTDANPGPNPDYARVRPDGNGSQSLFQYLFGDLRFTNWNVVECRENDRPAANVRTPLVLDSDFSDWRMVNVETLPIAEGDTLPSPAFWDLPALRTATTLRLKSPHVGFLGTLAWYGNWPTNESNQARVTANQALIAALGLSIIPAAAVAPAPLTASDSAHSTDPACAACHLVLDPLRQFFRQSYTFSYHEQRDLTEYLGNAAFLLGGMNVAGRGVEDLAGILASHPHFAIGWAQKLQFWANTNAADETDPELQRIARVFAGSHFDFRTLVREVFSSPLVTLARGTATYRTQGVTVGIVRRDQFCAALSSRLGKADACDLRRDAWSDVRPLTQMITTDTYYRAAELPSLPRNPDLFFRNSVEKVCERMADRVIGGNNPRYPTDSAAAVEAAIADLVATVMGLPAGDPRAAAATRILKKHYADALGSNAWDRGGALRSTFILACISPSSVLIGQ